MRKTVFVALVLLLSTSTISLLAQNDAAPPKTRQKAAAKASTAKGKAAAPEAVMPKAESLAPLSERDRAVQMLDRFTFGARPGDVDHVMSIGVDKWLEQQLNPDAIKDPALDRRLADFPTLNMT